MAPSPHASPIHARPASTSHASSPIRADEELTMVIPTIRDSQPAKPTSIPEAINDSDDAQERDIITPMKSLKVYEDPFSSTDDQTTPRPTITEPVLGEVPVNEDAANLARNDASEINMKIPPVFPERSKQNSRLLDSGITRVKAKTLDVHGFRKLQGLIRDNKAILAEDKFDALLLGLFEYLEVPLPSLTLEKAQDVRAQIIATIKLMLNRDSDAFKPNILRGLSSLLVTRSAYDARAHLVSGLELLAEEFVILAEPDSTAKKITALLQTEEMSTEGCRTLSMGLHILKELLDAKSSFVPENIDDMAKLAIRCLDSVESGVRMDAVKLCVAMHARVGEVKFWEVMSGLGVKDDPKNLITYYVVKRQRELSASSC